MNPLDDDIVVLLEEAKRKIQELTKTLAVLQARFDILEAERRNAWADGRRKLEG